MATLTTLKLITAKRQSTLAPLQHRRQKLSKKLYEQIELAKATAQGGTYTTRIYKTIRDENGLTKSVELHKRVRQWWWMQDSGKIAVSIRYGTKVIPLSPKANAVEVANIAELVQTLTVIKTAVDAGELDTQLSGVADKLRDGFNKK